MFNFRRDKTSFIVTLLLTVLAAGTVIATLVLILVGLAQGDWSAYVFPIKWVLGGAWVASILIVLVRVKILGYQLQRRRQTGAPCDDGASAETTSSEEGKVSS